MRNLLSTTWNQVSLNIFQNLSLVSLGSVRWDVKPNESGNREVYTLFYTNDINTEELTFKSVIYRSVFDPLWTIPEPHEPSPNGATNWFSIWLWLYASGDQTFALTFEVAMYSSASSSKYVDYSNHTSTYVGYFEYTRVYLLCLCIRIAYNDMFGRDTLRLIAGCSGYRSARRSIIDCFRAREQQ